MQLIKMGDRTPDRGTGKRVTTRKLYDSESRIAERAADPERQYGTEFYVPKPPPAELDDSQRLAFLRAFAEPFSIITAKPGYGKTRVVAAIAQAACDSGVPIGVGTFMGRAANRARQEMTKLGFDPDRITHGPGTLHSLFRIGQEQRGSRGSREANHTFDDKDSAGIFVIDEASMVAVTLLATVVRSLPPRWNIVLVGDADQLPPISAGNALADLINSKLIPVTTLTESYRADVPGITTALNKIQRREVPTSQMRDGGSFRVIQVNREDAETRIAEYVAEASRIADCDPAEVFVITAQRRPPKQGQPLIITNTLNKRLKAGLNPGQYQGNRWWEVSEGDRVYATGGNAAHRTGTRGDYVQRAYTGELGTVTDVSSTGAVIQWDDRPGPAAYGISEVWGREKIVDLAYAISVHSTQGGETSAVIFIADSNAYSGLLNRQLAYTACSRARKLCIVLDVAGGFDKAIMTNPRQRQTMLPLFLGEFAKERN